ncbi:hypothetical protein CRYUN_Cryun17cG0149200 [Craigia yunnanensis]
MGGAPTVLNMIVNSSVSDQKPLSHNVEIMTGCSPPSPQILFKMEELGFSVNTCMALQKLMVQVHIAHGNLNGIPCLLMSDQSESPARNATAW